MVLGYSTVNVRGCWPRKLIRGHLCSSPKQKAPTAGVQLKRKKIDCHFFGQQHLPASAAASGEIPCCLRKCPAELQEHRVRRKGWLCAPGVWECSAPVELPAHGSEVSAEHKHNRNFSRRKKRKGARMTLECEPGTRGMWQQRQECLIRPG